jgi:HNH endonuclease
MAAKDTPSMVKNKIKRSLLAIIDPHPTPKQINELWSFFNSTCAYCGIPIDRDTRTGHVDHVVSSALGGTNCIYNHVLSCARCNGDEKREESWQSFLAKKAYDPAVLAKRHAHITAWLRRGDAKPVPQEMRTEDEANVIINRALADFDSAVIAMRKLRKSGA